MSENYPLPPEHTQHRHFYERAVRLGFPVDAFITQIDAMMESYQTQAAQFQDEGATAHELFYQLVELSEQMETDIGQFLYHERKDFSETYNRPFKESMSSLRLGLLEKSVEPHLIWPVMARFGRDHKEAKVFREELSASMYGIVVDYLDYLTKSLRSTEFKDGAIRGSFNEFTGIALSNRRAGANRIALLGSLADDHGNKTDFHHYRFNGDQFHVVDTPVQVRSRSRSLLTPAVLDGLRHVKILTGEDMGNHYDRATGQMHFQTVRDMLQEVEGTATRAASTRLDTILAQQAFRNIIFAK